MLQQLLPRWILAHRPKVNGQGRLSGILEQRPTKKELQFLFQLRRFSTVFGKTRDILEHEASHLSAPAESARAQKRYLPRKFQTWDLQHFLSLKNIVPLPLNYGHGSEITPNRTVTPPQKRVRQNSSRDSLTRLCLGLGLRPAIRSTATLKPPFFFLLFLLLLHNEMK